MWILGLRPRLFLFWEYINQNFFAVPVYLLNPEKVEKGFSFDAVHDSGAVIISNQSSYIAHFRAVDIGNLVSQGHFSSAKKRKKSNKKLGSKAVLD